MDSDEGKLFIGGIAWDTTEEKLKDYFSHYGDVSQALIMRDKTTGRPRGFAFVVFSDPSVLDLVLQDSHTIDGRTVEAKRALSREEQQTSSRSGNLNAGGGGGGRGGGGGGSAGNFKTKKIFVGGLPSTLTEDGFRQYFESYGHVTDVVVMYDQNTQRPRGFGFITFDTEEAVDMVLHKTFHELNGKLVEVKKALPKDANPSGGSRGGGGGGGGYQSYGASGANASTLDARMDGNRYMQSQTSAAGFQPGYGYGAAGYGYGAASSGVGYGGYSGYAGFAGPTGAYGNPNAPNAGYVSGGPAALKTTWGSQNPSGYGAASGYGANAGYGGVSAPMGQSPSGASGYGSQGYGYGGYGVSDGPYSGGYGAAGGRAGNAPNSSSGNGGGAGEQQGSGYGDTNGNSGYANAAWRADPSQASGGYGGGYGGAHSRQASQQ